MQNVLFFHRLRLFNGIRLFTFLWQVHTGDQKHPFRKSTYKHSARVKNSTTIHEVDYGGIIGLVGIVMYNQ